MAELFANRYELLERIGAGGMAEVFRARMVGPVGFQKLVALKRILEDLCSDQDFLHRFIDEARLTARLQHPNICQVLDFGEVGGRYFITMEYVEGLDLAKTLMALERRRELLPPDLCLAIAAGVLRGLSHAHMAADDRGRRLGLVHRDVSPQNVLLSINGDIKLSDFGVAKANALVRRARTQENIALGKLAYMAPEQRRGEKVDERTDIYGTGILLSEMLRGPSAMRKVAGALGADREGLAASTRGRFPDDLAPRVGAIIERAVDPRPERRYSDAVSMLADVEQCARELGQGGASDRLGSLVAQLRGDPPSDSRSRRPPPTPPEPSIQEISESQVVSASTDRGPGAARAGDPSAGPGPGAPPLEELATQVRRGSPQRSVPLEELRTDVHAGRSVPLEEMRTQVRPGGRSGEPPRSPGAAAGPVGPAPPGEPPGASGASDLLRPRPPGPPPRPEPEPTEARSGPETPPSGAGAGQPVPAEGASIPGSEPSSEPPWRDAGAGGAGGAGGAEKSDRDVDREITSVRASETGEDASAEATERTEVVRRSRRRSNPMFWGVVTAAGVVVLVAAVIIGWKVGTRRSIGSQLIAEDLIGATPSMAIDGGAREPGASSEVRDAGGDDRPDSGGAEPVVPAAERGPRRPSPRPSPRKARPGRRDRAKTPSPSPARPSPAGGEPRRQRTKGGKTRITIISTPAGQPYIDGRMIGLRTPVQNYEVAPGTYNVWVVFTGSRQKSSRRITLRRGEHRTVRFTER